MSEKIVRAKRYHRLWFLGERRFDIVDVIAWAINENGPAVPITPFGRFDVSKPYVVQTDTHFITFPEGQVLHDSNAVDYYLRHGRAV
jgi:hypothetical protein